MLAASVGLFFLVEEHKTHHMLSGQGADSDAAPENEGIYYYAWRTHWTGMQAAWEWEMGSQIRQSRGAWSNRVVWNGAVPLALLSWFGLWLGFVGVLLYLTLIIGANFAFRGITYVQHWGLRNVPQICGGEGVAWTSTCIFQSWIIFNIAFHQDHHERPKRLYYHLISDPTSLKLPFTYPVAFLTALVPAMYRKVMSPRLAAWVAAKRSGESLYLDERCILPRAVN
jgi:alkane 1-monooxygenase